MTTPHEPGPRIPGFGPAAGYGAEPTQPLPPQTVPTQPLPAQPQSQQGLLTRTQPTQPYGGEPYAGQSYGNHSYQTAQGEPDWAAMADHYDAQAKRKRVLAIAGGMLAIGLVGGVTAFAWNSAKPTGSPTASPAPTGSVAASPSASAAPSASASPQVSEPPPLHPDQLFAASLKIAGKPYNRVATDVQTICSKAVGGGLAGVLTENHCRQVLRATYSSGKVSVTVGVAALPDVNTAMTTATAFRGKVDPLWHKGDGAFCKKSACAQSHAVEGRFLYLTVAGPNSGAAGVKDRTSIAAGRAAASAVLARLVTVQ